MLDKIKKFFQKFRPSTYKDSETGYSSQNITNSTVRVKKDGKTIEYKYDSEGKVTRKKY